MTASLCGGRYTGSLLTRGIVLFWPQNTRPVPFFLPPPHPTLHPQPSYFTSQHQTNSSPALCSRKRRQLCINMDFHGASRVIYTLTRADITRWLPFLWMKAYHMGLCLDPKTSCSVLLIVYFIAIAADTRCYEKKMRKNVKFGLSKVSWKVWKVESWGDPMLACWRSEVTGWGTTKGGRLL